jgi:hypothetical protein
VAVDTVAPTLTITDNTTSTANGAVTYTFNFSEAVTGFDASDVTLSVGSKGTFTAESTSQYTLVVTPPDGTGSITLDVAGGAAVDAAGNASTAAAQSAQAYSISAAGATTIDLGTDENGDSYGQLIAGIQVEGLWYYYWDRSGDGNAGGAGDMTTHTILSGIFKENVNGVVETSGNAVGAVGSTDNTYRYATINDVHLALPTLGGTVDANGVNTVSDYPPGTSVADNTLADNPTYDGLLAVWDFGNGTSTDTRTSFSPDGWVNHRYWTATPTQGGHAQLYFGLGGVYSYTDTNSTYVALQVL